MVDIIIYSVQMYGLKSPRRLVITTGIIGDFLRI